MSRRAAAIAVLLVAGCAESTAPRSPGLSLEQAYSFGQLAPSDFVTGFDFAGDGALWAITFEGLVLRMHNGGTDTFEGASIVGSSTVNDLFIDSQGRPWIAGGATIAMFDGTAWQTHGPPNTGELAPRAYEVAVNPAGDVLVAMGNADAGGLMLRHNGSWDVLTPENSTLESRLVNEIIVDDDGSFWVAHAEFLGRGGIANVSADGTIAGFDTDDGLLYDAVDDVVLGGGRLWLGYRVLIYDGLGFPDGGMQSMVLSSGQLTSIFPHATGLASNRVSPMTFSSAGELWFVTGLDQDVPGCETCVSAVGVVNADGTLQVISHLNADIDPNEFFTEIREGPDGAIYVSRADRRRIDRVVRG